MERIIKEAAEFLFANWKDALEAGQHDELAQTAAWELMRANYGWRGIGEREEEVIGEWFIEAMHDYFRQGEPETGEA